LKSSINSAKEIFENNTEKSILLSEKKITVYSKIQNIISQQKNCDLVQSSSILPENKEKISFDKYPLELDEIDALKIKLKGFVEENQILLSENEKMKNQLSKRQNDSEEDQNNKENDQLIIDDLKSILKIQKKEIKRLRTLMIKMQKENKVFELKEINQPMKNISQNIKFSNYLSQKEIEKDDDQELLDLSMNTLENLKANDANFIMPSRNDFLILSKLSYDDEKPLELNLDEINIGIKDNNIKEKLNNIKEINLKISNTCHLPISFSHFKMNSTSSFLFILKKILII